MFSAFLSAVRNRLLEEVGDLNEDNCELRIRGMPPPWAGEEYVGLYATGWEPGELSRISDRAIDEIYSFAVTITRRIGFSPGDRRSGEIYYIVSDGMEARARQITAAILKKRLEICGDANTRLQQITERGTITNGLFVEPLRWQGTDAEPREVGPEWFSANPDDNRAYGFALDIRFGDIRRIHNVSSME